MKSIVKTITLVIFVMILASCAIHRWKPVANNSYGIEKNYAVLANDSLVIALRPQLYTGTADDVNSRFFSIWLQIRNLSKRTISLNRNSFGIISDGIQYDYIPLEYVLGSLKNQYLLLDYEDPFQAVTSQSSDRLSNSEKFSESYFELLNSHLSFSDLLPGGTKEGYLFYNRKAGAAKNFSIDLLGNKIEFER